MKKVEVNLGENSYFIYIESNLFSKLPEIFKSMGSARKLYFITDDNVKPLYAAALVEKLQLIDIEAHLISIPAGEPSKSLEICDAVYTELIQSGATRQSTIVALGGGVVGDLAGFIAATFLRGIRFMQIPTTLLAQVDSSVGGKVGVNHRLGKNLIGAFYQPKAVYIDPATLKTLSKRELTAGMAEVIKYGLIRDAAFFAYLEENFVKVFLQDQQALESIIERCCRIKADIVSRDEKESGLRAILNFGHTIGHALEAATKYQVFLHGEAVMHGMKAAGEICQQLQLLSAVQADRIRKFLNQFAVPAIPANIQKSDLLFAIKKDKKRTESGQIWALLDDIGSAILRNDVPEDIVEEAIENMLSGRNT